MRYALSVSVPAEMDAPQAVTWATGVVKANLGKDIEVQHAERIEGSVMFFVSIDDPQPIYGWSHDSDKSRGRAGRLLWWGTVRRAVQLLLGLTPKERTA